MNALFIGRFQPFHLGHLQIIKTCAKQYDKIIIGIGSSQYKNTFENPFSSEERITMIKKTLDENKIKNYEISLIPDIHNYPKWIVHVASIVSDFDIVISNSSLTKSLFEQQGFKVEETPLFDRKRFSGKEIRNRIVNDDKWEELVPETVSKYINDINGIDRLKKLKKS